MLACNVYHVHLSKQQQQHLNAFNGSVCSQGLGYKFVFNYKELFYSKQQKDVSVLHVI